MTAPVTVTRCARCGASETAHELARDGRTRTVRLGQTAGASSSVACPGFEPGPVVELVGEGEGELRRRLDAVLALHVASEAATGFMRADSCSCGWRAPRRRRAEAPVEICPTVRAARGET